MKRGLNLSVLKAQQAIGRSEGMFPESFKSGTSETPFPGL